MRLKKLYLRFRAWQKDPFHYVKRDERHKCANCGEEFVGDYCPTCGQHHSVDRVTWLSVGQEIIRAWGVESGSLFASIVQLFGRPGYLIGDYIKGRRQTCYSPVSLLFVIALIAILVLRLSGLDMIDTVMLEDFGNAKINQAISWLWSNLGWCMIFECILFIIPTWLLFRHSPRNPHHTLPESVYIQLFMSSLVLIISTAAKAVDALIWLMPVYYFITYKQLFGYSFWGTFWRTALVLYEGIFFFFLILFIAILALSALIKDLYEDDLTLIALIVFTVIIVAINVAFLLLGYNISKKSTLKRA